MEISLLTQNNSFLLNSYTRLLARSLDLLGFRVIIFRTSATAKGKPSSKIVALGELFRFFGPGFTFRAIGSAIISIFRDHPARFPQTCTIIEVPDDQKIDAAFFRDRCSEFQVLLILAGTRIIRKEVLDLWTHGVLNVHSSILPYARGVMPALWTWTKGKGLGVTLFRLDEGIDTGEIIAQIPIERPAHSYFQHLKDTKWIGVQLLLNWVITHLIRQPAPGSVDEAYFGYPNPGFRLSAK